MSNLLELQDLYRESLTREIMEKTKSSGLQWTAISSVQFKATQIVNTPTLVQWDYNVTKTQIGNLSYQYTLDIKKNGVSFFTSKNGPGAYTDRDTMVQELYETVEVIVLQSDQKLKEILQVVQDI